MAQNISNKKSFIGENIKLIRQLKRLSQADFAKIFDLARPSIGAYEEGRADPKIETIIRIANYFRISIDVLLTRKLTTKEIFSLDQIKEKLDKVHNSKKNKDLPIDPSNSHIPFVSIVDSIDYLINHHSASLINRLPSIHLPISSKKTLRAFEVSGSEMEFHQQGLHHGDIVVCESDTKNKLEAYLDQVVVVITKESITVRRLKQTTKDTFTLKSDDPNYEDQVLNLKDILEWWVVKAAYTTYFNAPSLLEERVMKLEQSIQSLKKK